MYSSWLTFFRSWVMQFFNPLRMLRGIRGVGWFLSDYKKYSRLEGAERIRLVDLQPKLHDRAPKTPFDRHYFWMSGWAMRRILSTKPKFHVDVGSHNLFVNLLSAALPVVFLDYRPLCVSLSGLHPAAGNILELPMANQSVPSLSCLHVTEHIGLGRYGDPLIPDGTRLACAELKRILAPGGNLFFAVPVGEQRVCFNAHRIHAPETIVEYFDGLELVEFSGVTDQGYYGENLRLSEFFKNRYACGMFWFIRP